MTITKSVLNNNVTLSIEGSMDTYHSVQLSDELDQIFSVGKFNIYFDLTELSYISSSGLRVLIAAQKKATATGTKMEFTGLNDTVKEIFKITGFDSILTIR
jgi:anti-sigma B factor antagonist